MGAVPYRLSVFSRAASARPSSFLALPDNDCSLGAVLGAYDPGRTSLLACGSDLLSDLDVVTLLARTTRRLRGSKGGNFLSLRSNAFSTPMPS